VTSPAFDGEDIPHGSRIGRFVVEGQLGAGGMSVVYAARDRELDRRIALKVLRGAVDEAMRLRLLREGQAMARVTHPNVITVHEVGVEGRLVFLAQELLDGGTLRQWLAGRHPQRAILERFLAAGRGLAAAHAAGLVHRDFKPDNVLLGTDGRVRVADFGLARPVEAPPDPVTVKVGARVDALGETSHDLAHSPMSPLTRTGAVMGTPLYMAPEQHLGEVADARSDQFSFCVALYEALYRMQPFPGKTSVALADNVIAGRLDKPPAGAGVPARLRRILLRGLSTKPDARYPSMDALLADLAHEPGRKARRIAIAAGAMVLIGGAVGGGYALRARDDGAGTAVAVPAAKHELGTPRDAAAARAFAEGRAALRDRDFTTARARLGDVVQREPTFAPGQIALADAHAALFDAAAAQAAAKAALANAGALAREERLWVAARAHEHLGDRERARATYEELFGTERTLDVGLRLAALQATDDALATIASLRKQKALGTDPRLDVAAGRAWLARDPDEALAAAQRAVKAASDDGLVRAEARRLEGQAHRARLELDQAATALDDARKRFGSGGDRVRMLEVNGELAALAIERGDLDEASARYTASADIVREHRDAPQAGEALAGAAVVLARRGKLADAEAMLRDAAKLPASRRATAYVELARTELAIARHDRDGVARAQQCTVAAKPFPDLASRCLELQGEHLAARHDLVGARAAFNSAPTRSCCSRARRSDRRRRTTRSNCCRSWSWRIRRRSARASSGRSSSGSPTTTVATSRKRSGRSTPRARRQSRPAGARSRSRRGSRGSRSSSGPRRRTPRPSATR